MAGLHDMAPIVPTRWVMRTVFAPIRAAAAAASQPACPPPITETSNRYTIKTSGGAFSEGAGRGQNRGFIENVSRETFRLTGLERTQGIHLPANTSKPCRSQSYPREVTSQYRNPGKSRRECRQHRRDR